MLSKSVWPKKNSHPKRDLKNILELIADLWIFANIVTPTYALQKLPEFILETVTLTFLMCTVDNIDNFFFFLFFFGNFYNKGFTSFNQAKRFFTVLV